MDYRPEDPPSDPAALSAYLLREFARMHQSINSARDLMWLNKVHVAPTRPRDGMIANADGSDWNPGAGAGIYIYNGSNWLPLGGSYYGSMYDNGTTQAVVISAASTWTAVDGGMTGGTSNAFTFQNSRELKCNVPGKYMAVWTIGGSSAGGGDDIEGTLMINGTAQTNVTSKAYEPTANKEYILASNGILTLAANDVVKFALQNLTNGDDQTVDHANLTLLYVGP